MKNNSEGLKGVIVACTIVFFIGVTVLLQSCKSEAIVEKKVEEVIAPIKEEVKEVETDIEEIKNKIEEIVPDLEDKIDDKLNELPFGAAWRIMYNRYGQGHIFDWHDNCYTTNMKEEGEMSWLVR